MRNSAQVLRKLLERIFEDGVLEPHEREDLRALVRQGGLTVSEARNTFTTFVEDTWGEAIADGVLTTEEIRKLTTIVTELRLPPNTVPHLKDLCAAHTRPAALAN